MLLRSLGWLAGCCIALTTVTGCHRISIPYDDLVNAPEEITVSARACTLGTSLSRDFMPGGDFDSPLFAFVSICALDTTTPIPSLEPDGIWVIKTQHEIWESGLTRNYYQPYAYRLEALAQGGPKWGPSIYVDVVVRVTDSTGESHLLKAKHQYIGMTI